MGFPSNRSRMAGSPVCKPESTIRGRWASSWRGSGPTRTAWTTWSGCAGRTGSSARTAGTPAAGGWRTAGVECAACARARRSTAGTIFDRTRTPLTVWFNACWLFASQKDGISALSLQRTLEIGSYQTAWAMLHRLRSVLVRPGRERLCGDGGGRRDLHRRRGARAARRAPEGQEGAGRRRRGAPSSPRASGGAGWPRSRMPPRRRCARSSPTTSSRAPR